MTNLKLKASMFETISSGHDNLFIVSLRPDVPRNIVIKHDERFDLIPDQMDVICFVKRNASDAQLAQDT